MTGIDKSNRNILIYVLDAQGMDEAMEWVERLSSSVGVFKIGFQLFLREGPKVIEKIQEMDKRVFLDLKFYDIPHTVEKAAREAVRMGVFMFNVHASGGRAMMEAAVRGAQDEVVKIGAEAPYVLGVTVLTSMDEATVRETGIDRAPKGQVELLAGLARGSGLSGVVASPMEARKIKEGFGPEFLVVCPGIRPAGSDSGDQARIASPAGAIASGADYIVVGRPIRDAEDPAAAAESIVKESLEALKKNEVDCS